MHHRALCPCSLKARGLTYRGLTPFTVRHQLVNTSHPCSNPVRRRNTRLLSTRHGDENAATAPQPDDAGDATNGAWHTELAGADPTAAKDVFVDDLSATLEAHRESNRAAIIRRIYQDSAAQASFLNPLAVSEPDDTPTDGAIVNDDVGVIHEDLPAQATSDSAQNTTPTHVTNKPARKRRWIMTHWPKDSIQLAEVTGKMYRGKEDEVLEYEAYLLQPQSPYIPGSKTFKSPWLELMASQSQDQVTNSHQRLQDELKAYEDYMSLNSLDQEAAKLLISDVTSTVNIIYPSKRLEVIGSYSTGLANRLSDIDFNLSFPEYEKDPLQRGPSPSRRKARRDGTRALFRIEHVFGSARRKNQYQEIELIRARVPIVKAVHRMTHTKIELQTLASQTSSREYVATYLAEFPTLRTLYHVIRSALHIRHLTNVWKGGLGSYSIFMMLVNALKHASGKFASDDLANHFLYVLEFYADADLYKNGFSPDPPRQILKRGGKMSADEKIARLQDPMLRGIDILKPYKRQKPYLLFLQDPANPVNDLGAKAYGIKHVQYLFGHYYRSLRKTMRLSNENHPETLDLIRRHGLLSELLGANYVALERHRQQLHEWVESRKTTLEKPGLPALTSKENTAAPVPFSVAAITERDSQDVQRGSMLEKSKISQELSTSISKDNDFVLEESTVSANGDSQQADAETMHQHAIPQAEKANPLPIVGEQQTLSQNLFDQKREAESALTHTRESEAKKSKLTTDRAWKRWTPSKPEDRPQIANADVNSQSSELSQRPDIAHTKVLLERLRSILPDKDFVKLEGLNWQALLRLGPRTLRECGLDVRKYQNKIFNTTRSYVSRLPIEKLIAIENSRATTSKGLIQHDAKPRNTLDFLQSIGLWAHFKKLRSLDLHGLAGMSRLDYARKNISISDARKILQGLHHYGIRADERQSSTEQASTPGLTTNPRIVPGTKSPSLASGRVSSESPEHDKIDEHAQRVDKTFDRAEGAAPVQKKAYASLLPTAPTDIEGDTQNDDDWSVLVIGDWARMRKYLAEQNSVSQRQARWILKGTKPEERFNLLQSAREKHALPIVDRDRFEINDAGMWCNLPTSNTVSPEVTASQAQESVNTTSSSSSRRSLRRKFFGTIMKQRKCSQDHVQTIWHSSSCEERADLVRLYPKKMAAENVRYLSKQESVHRMLDLVHSLETVTQDAGTSTREAPIPLQGIITSQTTAQLTRQVSQPLESPMPKKRGIGRLFEAIANQTQCSNRMGEKIWLSCSKEQRLELLQSVDQQFSTPEYMKFIMGHSKSMETKAATSANQGDASKTPPEDITPEAERSEPTSAEKRTYRTTVAEPKDNRGWKRFSQDPDPTPSAETPPSGPPISVHRLGRPFRKLTSAYKQTENPIISQKGPWKTLSYAARGQTGT